MDSSNFKTDERETSLCFSKGVCDSPFGGLSNVGFFFLLENVVFVIPAQAGIQNFLSVRRDWMPACAGMTRWITLRFSKPAPESLRRGTICEFRLIRENKSGGCSPGMLLNLVSTI